ncbi:aspartate ammonia-lyase [Patescibacteria group bacterium]|nr:aspartate ammonia-lyase [Patescibacteria group bacterium]MBU1703170.1 aspartate ammonia-lyase [Patescibacteria group bacterium]MBU1954313.1 aspartate ammonia-lyase [Patescibacteria group bacterium]
MKPKKSATSVNQDRTETDVIGKVSVPREAYYGSFTARALQNFKISNLKADPSFKLSLAQIKIAAAQTNETLGEIGKKHAGAIIKAANEFVSGKFDDQFTLDIFQAGAGTPFNMNINEILANRGNELLGGKKGTYSPITPNNHVNWGQSSNDVIPTAIRLAALIKAKDLLPELEKLSKSFFKKGEEFKKILKVGRTHLQDAVPITLGQEFQAYGSAIKRSHDYIKQSFEHLKEVAIGGTALGTGITTHPKFRPLMVKNLSALSKIRLKATKYPMELSHNMNAFVMASNGLRCLAGDLIRISKDLRLLASGPQGAIYEITLPEVEPGSSIMPGKINPSIVECATMIGLQVMGNDHTIVLAAQNSELELNVMTPVILHNLLWSIEILTSGSIMLRRQCIDGIKANRTQCQKLLKKSLCLATGLSPYLGYKATAQLVKESLQKEIPLKELLKAKNFMADQDLETILSAEKLTSPAPTDQELKVKIATNKNFQKYLKA